MLLMGLKILKMSARTQVLNCTNFARAHASQVFDHLLRLSTNLPMAHIMGVQLHIHNPWSLCKLKLVLLCANQVSGLLDITADSSSS